MIPAAILQRVPAETRGAERVEIELVVFTVGTEPVARSRVAELRVVAVAREKQAVEAIDRERGEQAAIFEIEPSERGIADFHDGASSRALNADGERAVVAELACRFHRDSGAAHIVRCDIVAFGVEHVDVRIVVRDFRIQQVAIGHIEGW